MPTQDYLDIFTVEKVEGDGNGFYHAVAKQLQHNGFNEYTPDNLRALAVKYASDHKEEFNGSFAKDEDADEIINSALSKALGMNIVILQDNTTPIIKKQTQDLDNNIYLKFDKNKKHYKSLTKQRLNYSIQHDHDHDNEVSNSLLHDLSKEIEFAEIMLQNDHDNEVLDDLSKEIELADIMLHKEVLDKRVTEAVKWLNKQREEAELKQQAQEDVVKCGDLTQPIIWSYTKGIGTAEINLKVTNGQNINCVLRETMVGKARKIEFNEDLEHGPLHLQLALKDERGNNMPKKGAIYFEVEYDDWGKLVSINVSDPNLDIKFDPQSKQGFITYNDKKYTLPLDKEKYDRMQNFIQQALSQDTLKDSRAHKIRKNLDNPSYKTGTYHCASKKLRHCNR